MANVKERIAALERYKRSLDPSAVAIIAVQENGEWAAEYGGKGGIFPTEVQALHYIHQHAQQGTPTIIIDL